MGTIWGTVDANLVLCRDLDCQENADRHLALVRAAYERVTGNRWSKSDSEAYNENGITKLPADKIISAMETVTQRTSAKIQLQLLRKGNRKAPGSPQPRLAKEAAREDRAENPG